MDIKEVVWGSFELPLEVTINMPRIMILGNREIFVENYIALAEYKKDRIKLITKLGMTEIAGDNFEIILMKQNNIAIRGNVENVRMV